MTASRNELIEKMARAMCCPSGCGADKNGVSENWAVACSCEAYEQRAKATAALTAIEEAGMVVAPAIATPEMDTAGYDGYLCAGERDMSRAYRAMIAARPTATEKP